MSAPDHEAFGCKKIECFRQLGVAEFLQCRPAGLRAFGGLALALDIAVDAAALFSNFRQVADARAGDEHGGARFAQRGVDHRREVAGGRGDALAELGLQALAQVGEHPAHAGVVELRSDGRVDGHLVVGHLEGHAVALPLLAHIAQGVFGAAAVELVQDHQLGVIEHVDLFKLTGRAVVAGHHVHREVDEVDDLGIGLADTSGFHQHQVIGQTAQEGDAVLQHGVGGNMLATRRHRAHEHARAAQTVHADAVAEQRATAAAAGGVHRNHRDVHGRKMLQKTVDDLVGDRTLAGTTGAGQANHQRLTARQLPSLAQGGQLDVADEAFLDDREHATDGDLVFNRDIGRPDRLEASCNGATDEIFDHPDEAHRHAVVGVVDALDAVGLQFGDLLRCDGAAAAAENANVAGTAFAQHVHHVLEILGVAALVAGKRDAVGVLLQGRTHHVLDRAVVAQMHHLGTLRLDQSAHHVDGGVVAVEQRSGGDEAQRRFVVAFRKRCRADLADGRRNLGVDVHGANRIQRVERQSNALRCRLAQGMIGVQVRISVIGMSRRCTLMTTK